MWSDRLVCTMTNDSNCQRALWIFFLLRFEDLLGWIDGGIPSWLRPYLPACLHAVMNKATVLNEETAGVSGFIFLSCGQPFDCIVFSLWCRNTFLWSLCYNLIDCWMDYHRVEVNLLTWSSMITIKDTNRNKKKEKSKSNFHILTRS